MSNPNERQLGESQADYRKRRAIENVVDRDYLRGRLVFRPRTIVSKQGEKLSIYSQAYRKPVEQETKTKECA